MKMHKRPQDYEQATPVTSSNAKGAQMRDILEKTGVSIRGCVILGRFAHVDSYHKYEAQITEALHHAGFAKISVSDGIHLDNTVGPRFVFKLR